jgi:hypothetical protein
MLLAARFPRASRPSTIRREASIEPRSGDWFKVEFTACEALRQKLELCRDLMSHANPSRDLAVVVELAVDLLLADLQRKRLAKLERPREVKMGGMDSRGRRGAGIDRATRRAVFERDGLRCAYIAKCGRRCDARAFLELDHIDPRALGGASDAGNLRVLCRAHNQLWAEQAFGREWVERRRDLRQRKSTDAVHQDHEASAVTNERTATIDKVRLALRGLGFRDVEARRAVAAVANGHDPHEPIVLERALREALSVATAA